MKKVILSTVLILGAVITSQGQDFSKNSIGLRLGDNDGFGAELSYQRKLSDTNRLEFDLGWRNSDEVDAIKLAGLYQWVWNIDKGFVFVTGDVGLEYQFDFPLQLTLDVRPEIYLHSGDYRENNFGPDLALGIRYRFD
jgi:hypothetical protein